MLKLDPKNIIAILIGVPFYDHDLHPLKAAKNNVYEMENLFADEGHLGIPTEQIFSYVDTAAIDEKDIKIQIESFIEKIIARKNEEREAATINGLEINNDIELILFYFSGHGGLDDEKKYYLCLKKTNKRTLHTSGMEIDSLRKILMKHVKRVIMILDSCYSENLFTNIETREADYCLIASSAYNETSKYPTELRFSAFTGKMIESLKEGSQKYKDHEYLSWNKIFEEITNRLENTGHPKPKVLNKNQCGNLEFIRNKHYQNTEERFLVNTAKIVNAIKAFDQTIIYEDNPQVAILNRFPIFISYYLKDLFPRHSTQIDDKLFFIEFYKQIVKFLSFIVIKDLMDRRILKEKDKELVNKIWTPSHKQYYQTLKIACTEYTGLFMEEFKPDATFLNTITKIEHEFDVDQEIISFPEFRDMVIDLVSNLAFFAKYSLYTVRLIKVQKGFISPVIYRHETSNLYGQEKNKYKFNLNFPVYLHNGAVILYKKTGNHITHENEYLNLWPLIIDSNGKDEDSEKPEIQFYVHSNNLKFFYESVTVKKKWPQPKEYDELLTFPTHDEWENYYHQFQ